MNSATGAQLWAPRRIEAGEVIVAGEHSIGQAVVAVECWSCGGLRCGQKLRPKPATTQAGLDCLPIVYALSSERQILEAFALVQLNWLRCDALLNRES